MSATERYESTRGFREEEVNAIKDASNKHEGTLEHGKRSIYLAERDLSVVNRELKARVVINTLYMKTLFTNEFHAVAQHATLITILTRASIGTERQEDARQRLCYQTE